MFTNEKINNNTYKIQGRGCDCYLLIGKKEAIMIDSGCDKDNIQKYAQTLSTLPVNKVINTHSHFDHTGGNGNFKEVFMTARQSLTAKNWMDEDPNTSNMDYNIHYIEEGEFSFEGRDLYIIELNCHSPGNIAILDKTNRILFVGDEIDQNQVLLLPGFSEKVGQFHSEPAATVNDYKNMLLKLKQFENVYDILCTGHNGSPLEKGIIDLFLDLCNEILKKGIGSTDLQSETYSEKDTHFPYKNAHYLRANKNGCSLIYCNDDLYNRSCNSIVIPATPLHEICEKNIKEQER